MTTKSEPYRCVCGRTFWEKRELVAHMDNCGVFESDLRNPHAQLTKLRHDLAAARELVETLYRYAGMYLYEKADGKLEPGADATTQEVYEWLWPNGKEK